MGVVVIAGKRRNYSEMATQIETSSETVVAKPLGAEDLRCGDFVSILHEIEEWPSYLWNCDAQLLPPGEPVRIQRRPSECGQPLKVKGICLPFVFVKQACGKHRTLDVRGQRLVRLNEKYARAVWRVMRREAKGRGCVPA